MDNSSEFSLEKYTPTESPSAFAPPIRTWPQGQCGYFRVEPSRFPSFSFSWPWVYMLRWSCNRPPQDNEQDQVTKDDTGQLAQSDTAEAVIGVAIAAHVKCDGCFKKAE